MQNVFLYVIIAYAVRTAISTYKRFQHQMLRGGSDSTSSFVLHLYVGVKFICRGIEAVITGLTRNQFVDNTTRGFESLPLRQKNQVGIARLFLLQGEFSNV